MVERAAKAAMERYLAGQRWAEIPEVTREAWRAATRAAIEAMREPSGEMCEAGAAYYHDNYQPGRAKEQTTAPFVWCAMIDAALKGSPRQS